MSGNTTRPNIIYSLYRILRLIFRLKPGYLAVICPLSIAQGIIPTYILWLSKLIVDGVVKGIAGNPGAIKDLPFLLLLLLGTYILSNLIASASNIFQTFLGDIIANDINVKVIEKSASLDLSFYEDPEFYDMLARAQRESSYRPLIIITQVFELMKNLLALSSMMLVLLRLHWLAVLILVLMSVPSAIIQQKYAHKGYSLLFSQTQKTRKMGYLFDVLTSPRYFKEVKLFGLSGYFIDKYKKLFQDIYSQNRLLVLRKNVSFLLLSLLSVVSYLMIYAYIIRQAVLKIISIGDLTLYSGIIGQCQGRLGGLISNVAAIYENNLFINNLFVFIEQKPMIISPPHPAEIPRPIKEGIAFKGVSFKYPGTTRFVLEDLNFQIKPNESVAFVGSNGAGKSTLVKLLSRLYDPSSGEILLDGTCIRSLDAERYHDCVGIVFQDYSQYYLTARENIGFGRLEEMGDLAKIMKAASKSGAAKVIERLPLGYDTVLGRYFDTGSQLSEGEWQKIAIARAFIRNSDILVLDEPMSSVDATTEYEILQDFRELAKNRMLIIISHRFSCVRMVDRIFMLENGGILEQGSHDELMKLKGKYAAMFNMQAEKIG
jgi:ATP-binding cassette, subfamily B, bacterial